MNPQRAHDELLPLLENLVRHRVEHGTSGCSSLPLCPGDTAKAALAILQAEQPGDVMGLLLVALAVIGDEREKLRIQNGLTNDVVTAMELAGERADAAEAERERLLDRLEDTERRLAAVEADLTMWEDAADAIGPVGLPHE